MTFSLKYAIAPLLAVLMYVIPGLSFADIVYSQPGNSTATSTAMNAYLASAPPVTIATSTTIREVEFYCGLSTHRGADECSVILVDLSNPANTYALATVFPLIDTPPTLFDVAPPGGSVVIPAGSYGVRFTDNTSGQQQYSFEDIAGNLFLILSTGAPNSLTRIVIANPNDGLTIASSSVGTVGATVYINTAQWTQALSQNAGNWFLQITLSPPISPNVLGGAFASGQTRSFTFPVNTSGFINMSTTTDLTTLGDYSMSMQLVQPSFLSSYFSWFGFSGTILDSTTTRFTVVNQTGFDKLNSSSTSIIDQFLASSSPELIASCASFTSFDLADCLNLLFIPQPSTFSYVLADVQGILLFAPWGYATRVVSIFGGTGTSSLPLIAAGIPDPSNPHQYMMFHFDPNEAIAGAAALNAGIVDPVSGDPVMPGIRQIVDAVIALATMSYILYDLIGGKKSNVTHKTKLS